MRFSAIALRSFFLVMLMASSAFGKSGKEAKSKFEFYTDKGQKILRFLDVSCHEEKYKFLDDGTRKLEHKEDYEGVLTFVANNGEVTADVMPEISMHSAEEHVGHASVNHLDKNGDNSFIGEADLFEKSQKILGITIEKAKVLKQVISIQNRAVAVGTKEQPAVIVNSKKSYPRTMVTCTLRNDEEVAVMLDYLGNKKGGLKSASSTANSKFAR